MNRKITAGSKICNWSKLWNSFVWYWCYILTAQALTCIKGSWVQTSRPSWNNFTGILILTNGPKAILNQSCDSPQLQGSVHLCKLNDCQWRASTTKRNDCLLTGKLLCVTCKFWLKLRKRKNYFGHYAILKWLLISSNLTKKESKQNTFLYFSALMTFLD